MIFFRLFKFLRGYLKFQASGGFPERFLNMCSARGIPIWNLNYKKGVMYGETDTDGYKKMRHVERSSGMKVKILKKIGLPFMIFKYRRRVGLIIGLIFMVVSLSFLSKMIWSVEVIGNKNIRSETIISLFNELGVKNGTKISSIDTEMIVDEARAKAEGIAWMSLNINGSTAVIDVRESKYVEFEDKKTPANIIASKGGKILILEAYAGNREVITGASVLKGDLLVGGVYESKTGSVSLEHAKAYVLAETENKVSVKIKNEEKINSFLGRKSGYIYDIFSKKIPIGFGKKPAYNFLELRSKSHIKIKEKNLPFEVERIKYISYGDSKISYIKNEMLLKAVSEYNDSVIRDLHETIIKSHGIDIKNDKNTIEINGNILCEENIAKEIKIDSDLDYENELSEEKK